MKTVALNDDTVSLVDKLFSEIILADLNLTYREHFKNFSYGAKVAALINYLNTIEEGIKNEQFNLTE